MFTSPGPEAAKKPARATTPDPITDSWTTLEGPRITSSIRIEFATVVRAPMRTFLPRLVDGRRTAFGPISHPAPIDSGPWRYAPERITHPSPIVTRPRIVTAGSIVPARRSAGVFWAVALRRGKSPGDSAAAPPPSVGNAATEGGFAGLEMGVRGSGLPSFAGRSISS